jgi:hypothetical protein
VSVIGGCSFTYKGLIIDGRGGGRMELVKSILKRVVMKSDPRLTVFNQKISRVKFKEDIILTSKFMNRE